MVALPPVVAARWPSRASASCKRANEQAAHQAGIAETHFRFCRMHIDVNFVRIDA